MKCVFIFSLCLGWWFEIFLWQHTSCWHLLLLIQPLTGTNLVEWGLCCHNDSWVSLDCCGLTTYITLHAMCLYHGSHITQLACSCIVQHLKMFQSAKLTSCANTTHHSSSLLKKNVCYGILSLFSLVVLFVCLFVCLGWSGGGLCFCCCCCFLFLVFLCCVDFGGEGGLPKVSCNHTSFCENRLLLLSTASTVPKPTWKL